MHGLDLTTNFHVGSARQLFAKPSYDLLEIVRYSA